MHTMDILRKLFGSEARVKMLRLFLMNETSFFETKEVSDRAKVKPDLAKKELNLFENIGLVKKKDFVRNIEKGEGEKMTVEKKKCSGWTLDQAFPLLRSLQVFLISAAPLSGEELVKKLSAAGKIKVIVTAGVFIQDKDSRVDMMVVGDGLKMNLLENVIRTMESEIGKELRYAAFETEDFKYRISMCDKLVRDVLDFPHEVIIDKIGAAQ